MTTRRLRDGLDPRAFDVDGTLKWTVVAAIISEHGDVEYTGEQVRKIASRALKKLRAEFEAAEGEDTRIALVYFADVEAGKKAYRAWKHRVAPKTDADYTSWGD